jgi:rSAM/selenodomain-associated transferase 1
MTASKDCALIIFVRNPELGKVKTRLAKTIGDEQALQIYKQLLQRTVEVTRNLASDKYVFYADGVNPNDVWENERYNKRKQEGDDLGERMQNAFQRVFNEGFAKVAIIGSDCYDLTSEIVTEAFEKLDAFDAVLGPSTDGGYYLFGMKNLVEDIFKDKRWSTESVLNDTINDLTLNGCSFFRLPALTDVDEEENIPAQLLQKLV